MTKILTDDQLFNLCKKYGENARHWKQKFAGLLPEVYKRRLYEKKGCGSIFEFAAKFAGMSQEQVRRVLNLEKAFEDKPSLHSLLINGEVSVNKLARIASIATIGNQEELVSMAQNLSQSAIETFVKDERRALNEKAEETSSEICNIFELIEEKCENGSAYSEKCLSYNGTQKPLFGDKYVRVHTELSVHAGTYNIGTIVKIMEKLSAEVQEKLIELVDKNIDINRIILEALNSRKTEIARAKEEIAAEMAEYGDELVLTGEQNIQGHVPAKSPSRYIPAKIRRIINEEQGDRCSVPHCNKPAEVTHHELPFAMTKTHDPYNLKKLCKAHHELKHTIDIKFHEIRKRVAA